MPREAFPSDLTDAQWEAVEPLIPPPERGGRKRRVDVREVVNAIRYLCATDCGWRELPTVFPNRSTVRHYHDAWRRAGVWARVEGAAGAAAPNHQSDENLPNPGNGTS